MKTNNIAILSIPEIKKLIRVEEAGDDILVVSGRNPHLDYDALSTQPFRVDGLMLSLCMGGEADVVVNEKEYQMANGSMSIKTPGTLSRWDRVSEDYEGYQMILSMDFVRNLPFDLKDISTAFACLKHESYFRLGDLEREGLYDTMRLIGGMNGLTGHFRMPALQGMVVSLLYGVCELVHRKKQDLEKKLNGRCNKDRRHYYLLNFLELLGKFSSQERGIAFYAKKLFLTPKYFSTVIKEVSGKSAREWIDEYVMIEAKALLQHSDANISETAYHLNFPNASFFGRYFKKHTGMSPGDFKKKFAI